MSKQLKNIKINNLKLEKKIQKHGQTAITNQHN